jgi:hypothetical protein
MRFSLQLLLAPVVFPVVFAALSLPPLNALSPVSAQRRALHRLESRADRVKAGSPILLKVDDERV